MSSLAKCEFKYFSNTGVIFTLLFFFSGLEESRRYNFFFFFCQLLLTKLRIRETVNHVHTEIHTTCTQYYNMSLVY